jgi:hypothetical protein
MNDESYAIKLLFSFYRIFVKVGWFSHFALFANFVSFFDNGRDTKTFSPIYYILLQQDG